MFIFFFWILHQIVDGRLSDFESSMSKDVTYIQYRMISIPFMPFLYKIVAILPASLFWVAACPKGYVKAFGWAAHKYRME